MVNVPKIKIIQIISDSLLGGGSKHVLGLLKNLDKKIFSVMLIAPDGWLTNEAKKISGVKIKKIRFKNKFDCASLSQLKKEIAKFRSEEFPFSPLILHSHGPRAGLFTSFAKRPGEISIYTEHLWNADFKLKNPLSHLIQKKILAIICQKADKVIAVSGSVEKFLVGEFKIGKEKIATIANAIELIKKIGRTKSDNIIIGTVGSLVRQKGQIYLIEAFSKVLEEVPSARLEIIGGGPEKSRLKNEISNLGIESKIHLLGEQRNLSKYYQNWELFVLPSLSETFGIVILEAMNYEIPVIASDVGGIPEIVKDGQTGVLVKKADVKKLTKAILRSITHKTESQKMAKNAKEFLRENFGWSDIINKVEKVYISATK